MTPFIAMLLEPCSILVIHRAESHTRTVHSGKRLAVYAIWLGPGADVTLGLRLRRIAPGTRESLGHRCWQLRHAHMCISGPVNSWPDIVQLTIGWTLWLRHFWQVMSTCYSQQDQDGTSNVPSSQRRRSYGGCRSPMRRPPGVGGGGGDPAGAKTARLLGRDS